MVELRIKIPLPEDPAKRALVIAIVGSILLHLGLLAWLIVINPRGTPAHVKQGEPLLVDLAPNRPEEKAPLGNPSKPAGAPAEPTPKAPEPPAPRMAAAPPAPKAMPAPKPPAPPKAPPAPRAAPPPRPAPEPPKQVAKAEPPPPAPKAPPEPPDRKSVV